MGGGSGWVSSELGLSRSHNERSFSLPRVISGPSLESEGLTDPCILLGPWVVQEFGR